ncbi:MAG: penicillin-binding protein 1A [Elusimicrobiota bacterium]
MKKKYIIISIFVFIIASIIGGGWLLLISYSKDLPSTSSLVQYKPEIATKIYDVNGTLIDELYMKRRTLVPLNKIPVNLQNAVLATEDTNFFNHWGLDILGVLRAFIQNLRAGYVVQGGSTISQQLAKVMFLTSERTLKRKIKELILAMYIERQYSKEEILQFYLNQIYFGEGAYGVEAASKIYFNKSTEDLSLSECAMLAGLPRAPTGYSPDNNIVRAYHRRATVLSRMYELGFITKEEKIKANSAPLPLSTFSEEEEVAPYFIEHIRKKLISKFGANLLYKGGLRIYTTMDLKMQEIAQETLYNSLEEFDKSKKLELKEEEFEEGDYEDIEEVELSTGAFQEVQGAIISIDPKNGQIRAMVGGRDFEDSEFNRAMQANRQPGSGFKPFIYTAAIDNGYTAASILKDTPRVYYNDGVSWNLLKNTTNIHQLQLNIEKLEEKEEKTEEEEEELESLKKTVWSPSNYYNKYRGEITLRNALVKSINCATVDLLYKIRPVTALYYARKMGIESKNLPQSLSLGLGSGELKPIEMASAYSVFANQGVKTEPYTIIKVEDYSGNVLMENFPSEEQVLSPQTNYIMVNLMEQVAEHGTGWYTNRLGRPRAGKTGTTNDFSDAWFTGYVPNLVTSVWVGYDDRSTLGERKSAAVVAVPIWTQYMQKALEHTPVLDFAVPDGITFEYFDPETGHLATRSSENAVIQAFIEGTEPQTYF